VVEVPKVEVRIVEVPGPERIVEKEVRVEVPVYVDRTENVCSPAKAPAPRPNPLRKPPKPECK
jgi:hypothetical protein